MELVQNPHGKFDISLNSILLLDIFLILQISQQVYETITHKLGRHSVKINMLI